jgi:hypothetical protein
VEDKRLETDLESLRQVLWEDTAGDPRDALEATDQDRIRWIDTSAMLADSLTKTMKCDRLRKFLDSGDMNLEATDESKLLKMKKQKARASATLKDEA